MAKKIKDENGNVYVQKKPFYKKWWFIAIVIIGVFGNLFGNKTEKPTDTKQESVVQVEETKTTTSETPASSTKTEEPAPSYTIGQVVKVGDVEYTVNSVEMATNVGGDFGKNSNGVFVLVNVTVTNKGTKAITVDSNFFTLVKGETQFEADSSAGIYANQDANFFLTQLNPESTVSGNVVFDVAETIANAPELQLQVQTGIWGTQKGLINLR